MSHTRKLINQITKDMREVMKESKDIESKLHEIKKLANKLHGATDITPKAKKEVEDEIQFINKKEITAVKRLEHFNHFLLHRIKKFL